MPISDLLWYDYYMRTTGSRRWKQEQRALGLLESKRGEHLRDSAFHALHHPVKHGHAPRPGKTPEYLAYMNAKRRCNDSTCTTYQHYGGRGIKFLYTSFEQFIADVGLRPPSDPGRKRSFYSLDRINNDGHYEPENCRWDTQSSQVTKRRQLGRDGWRQAMRERKVV